MAWLEVEPVLFWFGKRERRGEVVEVEVERNERGTEGSSERENDEFGCRLFFTWASFFTFVAARKLSSTINLSNRRVQKEKKERFDAFFAPSEKGKKNIDRCRGRVNERGKSGSVSLSAPLRRFSVLFFARDGCILQ